MLSKLAYLTLCRSIQALALLARGDAAKDLEILVLRHQLTTGRGVHADSVGRSCGQPYGVACPSPCRVTGWCATPLLVVPSTRPKA